MGCKNPNFEYSNLCNCPGVQAVQLIFTYFVKAPGLIRYRSKN
jgi:hypothetical protein